MGGNFITRKKEMRKLFTTMALMGLITGAMTVTSYAGSNSPTVYKSLGGKKAIIAVVDDFVGRVAADGRINSFFEDAASDPARLAKFKKNLVDQICEATGGPCKYTGKDMKSAHAGLGIGSADFNALVEDLVATLDKFHVKDQNKNALLDTLGPMKSDIVEKP